MEGIIQMSHVYGATVPQRNRLKAILKTPKQVIIVRNVPQLVSGVGRRLHIIIQMHSE